MWLACARSEGDQYASMSSTGGWYGPGRPRRMFAKPCWIVVKRWRASSSVSAATTLSPAIT